MTLDELLAAVAADLRSVGLHVAPETLATDAERSAAMLDAGAALHPTGRRLFLRLAASFIGRGLEARAAGDAAEASRWADRALAELDRYREPAPELQPYLVTAGGVS